MVTFNLNLFLSMFAIIIFVCIWLNKISSKLGIPVLLLFIGVGMIFGWQDTNTVEQNEWVNNVCTAALIFIMFYGGFGTNWKTAKPIATEAGILATLGVFATAALVGVFCHYVLNWEWVPSLLLGAVTSSTDAASVFSILRTHKLGLKNNTAPLLEVESGSNDPCSYMSTAIMLTIAHSLDAAGNIQGDIVGGIIWMFVAQFLFAGIGAFVIYKIAKRVLTRYTIPQGFDMMYMLAVAIAAYALPASVGGNGYLSTYLVGIAIGNAEFTEKKSLVHFFDGVTSLMQILIFFLLGTMFRPAGFTAALLPALLIFLFMTFVGRPIAVSSVLLPVRWLSKKVNGVARYPMNQQGLISFVGLRGAASIVFAISILTDRDLLTSHNIDIDLIFDVVFCLVLVSIALQGSLIPFMSKKLNMIDESADVMATFSDFSEHADMAFVNIHLRNNSPWSHRMVKDLNLPTDMLVSMVVRDGKKIIPHGSTELLDGDRVIFCCKSYQDALKDNNVREHEVREGSRLIGKYVKDVPLNNGSIILMIRRDDKRIVPHGTTEIQLGDIIVFFDPKDNQKVEKDEASAK